MEFKGFGKNSGPVVPPKSQAPFGDMPRPPYSPPHPFTPPFPDSNSKPFARESILQWSGKRNSVDKHFNSLPHNRPIANLPHDSMTSNASKISQSQDPKKTVSPPFPYADGDFWRKSSNFNGRPGSTLDSWGNQTKSTGDDNNLSNHGSRSPTEEADFRLQRSPNLSAITETVQKSSHLNQVISGSYAAPKRTRSPPSLTEEAFQENSNPKEDINERELQAKAKRLARFKGELSDLVENGPSVAHRNFPSTKSDQFVMEKQKFVGDYWVGSAWDLADDIDDKGLELSGVIVGLCPDMCPGSVLNFLW